jgi:hypothetical protein
MSSDGNVPVDAPSFFAPQDLNRVSLGFDRLNNTAYINGHLKKFSYYSSPLTEDNLRALTGNKRSITRVTSLEEPIVTSGLVLYLDAGNLASYPGSGTTWIDLSGNGNNGTLVNGVGFDGGNGGSLSFDGVNDYVNCGTVNFSSGTSVSVEVWVKPGSIQKQFADILDYNHSGTGGFVIQQNSTSTNQYYFAYWNGSSFDVTPTITLSTSSYNHLIFTKSGTSVLGYLNSQNTINYTGSSVISLSGRTLHIGRFVAAAGREFNGNITSVKIYNRALTAEEIQQNFNALRGRFGI